MQKIYAMDTCSFSLEPRFYAKKVCKQSSPRRQLFHLSSLHIPNFAKYESLLSIKSRLWTYESKAHVGEPRGKVPQMLNCVFENINEKTACAEHIFIVYKISRTFQHTQP